MSANESGSGKSKGVALIANIAIFLGVIAAAAYVFGGEALAGGVTWKGVAGLLGASAFLGVILAIASRRAS